jgi:hypothetical protein
VGDLSEEGIASVRNRSGVSAAGRRRSRVAASSGVPGQTQRSPVTCTPRTNRPSPAPSSPAMPTRAMQKRVQDDEAAVRELDAAARGRKGEPGTHMRCRITYMVLPRKRRS